MACRHQATAGEERLQQLLSSFFTADYCAMLSCGSPRPSGAAASATSPAVDDLHGLVAAGGHAVRRATRPVGAYNLEILMPRRGAGGATEPAEGQSHGHGNQEPVRP